MARELLPGPGGVVVDDECLTLVDTRAVPWEPAPGAPGVWIRPLVRDASGAPLVYVEWRAPVAPGPSGAPVPRRHLHRTVGVRRFVLGGEGPTWEYESATQQHGDLLLLREGWYVDRDPGSIHGIEPAATTPVGITSLCWRTGSGTFSGEPSCAVETADVPYGEGWRPRPGPAAESPPERPDGEVRCRGGLRVLDTRALPWEAFDGIPGGGRQKVLARDGAGNPMVTLTWTPPGPIPGLDYPYFHYHTSVTENIYVLEGAFPHWERPPGSDSLLTVFRAGWFMQRRPGPTGAHGLEASPVPETGVLLLGWRDGTGNYVDEPDYPLETVRVR